MKWNLNIAFNFKFWLKTSQNKSNNFFSRFLLIQLTQTVPRCFHSVFFQVEEKLIFRPLCHHSRWEKNLYLRILSYVSLAKTWCWDEEERKPRLSHSLFLLHWHVLRVSPNRIRSRTTSITPSFSHLLCAKRQTLCARSSPPSWNNWEMGLREEIGSCPLPLPPYPVTGFGFGVQDGWLGYQVTSRGDWLSSRRWGRYNERRNNKAVKRRESKSFNCLRDFSSCPWPCDWNWWIHRKSLVDS